MRQNHHQLEMEAGETTRGLKVKATICRRNLLRFQANFVYLEVINYYCVIMRYRKTQKRKLKMTCGFQT